MKQKLILLALVIGLTIVSQSSLSLGMGKIQVYSALNEPLRSSIELITNVDEELENLEVKLASSEDYQKVGLDKTFVPANIKVAFDEENPYQINVTSNGPVTEPIVSLLLDVNWNNGRILREFTILLDPPLYDSNNDVQVNNVVVEPIQDNVIEDVVMEDTNGLQPREEESTTYTNEDVAVYNDSTDVETANPAYVNAGSEVDVDAGDTLWRIANENKVGDLSTHQMMMAIYNSNPNAFIDNNINKLVKGSRLTMPTLSEATNIGYSEALAQVESHHQSWSPAEQSYTTYQTEDTNDEVVETTESNLDYGVQLSGGDSDGSDSGQSNSDQGTAANVQAMEEDLYNKDSENNDLKERISELEDIVEQQQDVIEISDDDLANLENQLGNAAEDTEAAVNEVMDDVAETTDAIVDDIWDNADDESADSSIDDAAVEGSGDALNLTVDAVDAETENEMGVVDDVTEDTANVVDQSSVETKPEDSVSPPKFSGAQESESFVDTAVNWVMDNLKWVLIGLGGLIVLLFLPKLLRRSEVEEDDTSFLDDIKNRSKDEDQVVADEPHDEAETKMNEPLVEDDFMEQSDNEDDVLAELDKSIMFDGDNDSTAESDDDFNRLADEEIVENKADDGFDLDGFLNDDDTDDDNDQNHMSVTADHSATLAGVSFNDTDDETAAESDDDLFDDLDLDLDDDIEDIAEDVQVKLDDVEETLDDVVEEVATDEVIEQTEEDEFSFDDDFDFDLDEELDETDDIDDNTLVEDEDAELSSSSDDDFNDMLDISEEDTETFEINEDEEVDMDNEIDLGLEDLLEEGDAIDTKFDLAKAYIDMGDAEGAKNLLDEIVSEGSEAQVEAAKKLLDDM